MAGQLTIDTLRASSGVLATQNGMTGIAKAFVQFTATTGTINSSFNVSSLTRNAAGNYSLAFTTAMPNINYSVVGSASADSGTNPVMFLPYTTTGEAYSAPTTSGFNFVTFRLSAAMVDSTLTALAVFSA